MTRLSSLLLVFLSACGFGETSVSASPGGGTPGPSGPTAPTDPVPPPDYGDRGEDIAFTRNLAIPELIDAINISKGASIWGVKSDGSGLKALLDEPGASSLMPAYSPDKSRIVFASNRGGDHSSDASPPLDLWIMNHDGSAPVQLTKTANAHEWTPVWSPRGDLIAYSTTSARAGSDKVWHLDVWVIKPDGTDARLIYAGPGQDEDPVFSRDGLNLYFMVGNGPSGCFFQIWKASAYGSPSPEVLKDANGQAVCGEDPSTSPDGKSLVYAHKGQLYTYDFSSKTITQIGGIEEPWIGTDSRRITFVRGGQIWVGDLQGGEPKALTEGPSDYFPRWAP
ncbi:MAG: hypothetical protein ACE366_19555 [Bradymonadia bacterium]